MKRNEDHIITQEHLQGNWSGKDGNREVTMKISEEEVHLQIKPDGLPAEMITFPFGSWWIDDYLAFINNSRFYVSYANETELEMAELEIPGIINSGNRWEMKLQRFVE
ncbi:MAG TPA: hypothetical protein VGC65_09810 [Bacteroidia bacterium]|jgi:hypothetical protein